MTAHPLLHFPRHIKNKKKHTKYKKATGKGTRQMIDAVKTFYKRLNANDRKRLLMRMGISQATLYRRTESDLTAYEIKALIISGMDKKALYAALGL